MLPRFPPRNAVPLKFSARGDCALANAATARAAQVLKRTMVARGRRKAATYTAAGASRGVSLFGPDGVVAGLRAVPSMLPLHGIAQQSGPADHTAVGLPRTVPPGPRSDTH